MQVLDVYMMKLIWNRMQVFDRDHKAYFKHDASIWCIWSSLFETQCNLLIYIIKVFWDSIQVVDVCDQAFLRHNVSCWYIW